MNYKPPSTQDLATLKHSLNLTGAQMADLFGLAGDHQWRKYTGGQQPRPMSMQMMFYAMARIELDEATVNRVIERMRKAGVTIDLSTTGESDSRQD